MNDDMGVYKIINLVTGKFYIGSSIHLKRRNYEHRNKLKNNNHPNPLLQNSYNKHGIKNFKTEIIETVEDETKLLSREQHWLDDTRAYDNNIGYNINVYSTGGGLFGEKNPMYGISPKERMDSDTYKKWLLGRQGENASKPMLGKNHSIETKHKISRKRIELKYKHSEEWKKNHSEKLKGHTVSDEQKKKLSDFMKLNPTPNDKKVICIETGIIYKSISSTAREFNVTKQAISNAIRGKSKTCKRYHWAYCED